MAAAPPDPLPIAESFTETVKGYYESANLPGIGSLYGEDSSYTADGTQAVGPAGIFEFFKGRFAAGPVKLRYLAKADAQFTSDGSKLLVMVTGDSSVPAARFTEVFVLAPNPAGSMYVRSEIVRFAPAMPSAKPFYTEKDPGAFGTTFAQNYYKTYTENPAGLLAVYREESQLTFEGQYARGVAAITDRLSKLPRGAHALETLDIVPVGPAGGAPEGIVVMVTGKIVLEGQTNPLPFTQVFNLVPDAAGSIYIANELYRFVYG